MGPDYKTCLPGAFQDLKNVPHFLETGLYNCSAIKSQRIFNIFLRMAFLHESMGTRERECPRIPKIDLSSQYEDPLGMNSTLQLSSQRVWSPVLDEYLHRMRTTSSDRNYLLEYLQGCRL